MDNLGCATCHVKVSRIQRPDGSIYYDHVQVGPKHRVEPIHLEPVDLIEVCDFCLTPNPRWEIPLLDHATTTMIQENFDVTSVDTDALWGACDECAECVRTRSIGKLRDRALAAMEQKYAPEPTPVWARESVLVQLFAFWSATPGPVTRYEPTG